MSINKEELSTVELPSQLLWLADSPLFIDSTQIENLSSAVLGYGAETESITLDTSREVSTELSGTLAAEAGFSTSDILSFFTLVKPEFKVSAEASGSRSTASKDGQQVVLRPLRTAQRQLVLLTVHYYKRARNRIFFQPGPEAEKWNIPTTITETPRAILFLELPSLLESQQNNLPQTKFIPTAAEFSNGKIVTFFDKVTGKDGRNLPPHYPELKEGMSIEELKKNRKEYWHWFDENFSATKTMILVEQLASENGKINWINYRIVLNSEGDSLHLNIRPSGKYDSGVFAYDFIKRGFTHGIRLVGTLRSEPSMNVLAIYDK